jgi:hypothetical protein
MVPLLEDETRERVQKAFSRGQRMITIDGREFALESFDRVVSYVLAEGAVKKVERWINIHPADGALTPSACIEHTKEGNFRSRRSGAFVSGGHADLLVIYPEDRLRRKKRRPRS